MKKKLLSAAALAMACMLSFAGCSSSSSSSSSSDSDSSSDASGVLNDNVLTVAMECGYAPFNWTQSDDSNGGVKIQGNDEYAGGYDVQIKDSPDYAYGYDVMMAKHIA